MRVSVGVGVVGDADVDVELEARKEFEALLLVLGRLTVGVRGDVVSLVRDSVLDFGANGVRGIRLLVVSGD